MAKSNKQPAYLPPPKTTKTVKGQKYSGSRTKEGKSNNSTTTTTNGNTLSTSGPVNGDASSSGDGGNRSGGNNGSQSFTGIGKAGGSATPFNFNQEADLPQFVAEDFVGHG